MNLYPYVKLAHVLGAITTLSAMGIQTFALARLRRAETTSDVRAWVAVLAKPPRFGAAAMVVLLGSGGWLMARGWGRQPWILSTFATLGVLAVLSLLVSRRRIRRLSAAVADESGPAPSDRLRALRADGALAVTDRLQLAGSVAVVALMSLKPDATGSALLLAASAGGGLLAGLVSRVGARWKPEPDSRLKVGTRLSGRAWDAVSGDRVPIPDSRRLVHLQFRRFAGCPICHLHLRSLVKSQEELGAAGLREVIVFHSPAEELKEYAGDFPFDLIADPELRLYREFGVEAGARALLDPRAWPAILLGVLRSLVTIALRKEQAPSLVQRNGRVGLPADFLIASDGTVVARKYGRHADDQWSVEELLALAERERA